MNKIFNAVYYVESTNQEKAYNPVAIKPSFFSYDTQDHVEKRCDWNDTDRGAYFFYQKINFMDKTQESVPHQFKLIGENDEEISFTYLTTSLFNEKIADKVSNPPHFSQDNELQNYYLKHFS